MKTKLTFNKKNLLSIIKISLISSFMLNTLNNAYAIDKNIISNTSTKKEKENLDKKLYKAIENNNFKEVKLLIAKGADINQIVSIETPAISNKGTPIIFASILGNKDIVELLIENGADINSKVINGPHTGYTPLMFASWFGHKKIVELLIKNRADLNSKSLFGAHMGYTALMLSSASGQKDIPSLLVESGADVNNSKEFKNAQTPLMWASMYGHKELVELLISNGADINAQAFQGRSNGLTALMFASGSNKKEIVEILISKGADINIKNKDGKTASDFALENGFKDISDLIKNYKL